MAKGRDNKIDPEPNPDDEIRGEAEPAADDQATWDESAVVSEMIEDIDAEADADADAGAEAEAEAGVEAPASHVPFVPPTPLELEPYFPNLEIHEVIAAGGMGAVYRVRQPQLDRFVALKVLPPESGQDAEYVERFGREAKLMAQLNHPNIVGIYDFGSAGDLFYFIMEFVDGQTLHEAIQVSPVPPNAARLLMLQIAKGLKYAHDKGVRHLDIKPGNLMVNAEGVVKILDFGLANLVGHDEGEAFGTPHYTAPERYTKGAAFDHRADLFSLGAVFYEMLTQVPPQGEFTPASQIAGSPTEFDDIIDRCLQADPEKRYPDAGALGAHLAQAKNARGSTQLGKTGSVVVRKPSTISKHSTGAVPTIMGGGQSDAGATGAGAEYRKTLAAAQKKKTIITGVLSLLLGVGGLVTLLIFLAGGGPDDNGDGGGGTPDGGGGAVVTPTVPVNPINPSNPPVIPPDTGEDKIVADRSPKSEVRLAGDGSLEPSESPKLVGRSVEVDALIETGPISGVIVQQGGEVTGYSLYFENGFLYFAVRSMEEKGITSLRSPEKLKDQVVAVGARLDEWGAMKLIVNGDIVSEGSAGKPFASQPSAGVSVGTSGGYPVGAYPEDWKYEGYIHEVVIRTAPPSGGGPFDGPFSGR